MPTSLRKEIFLSPRSPLTRFLKEVYRISLREKVTLYSVGGFLRDLILSRQRQHPDVDFCLSKGAIAFGRKVARALQSGFVILDRDRGYCRLVKKMYGSVYTLDFTNYRGKTLEEDLRQRDFTINALAVELEKLLDSTVSPSLFIDPYGGREDIRLRLIRIVDPNNFRADPLRILRAFSLAATFDFKIEKKTMRLMFRDKKGLAGVSYERIRDELFKVLHQPSSYEYFVQMDRAGILGLVIPEIEMMRRVTQGPYHHLDVWKHSLETLKQFERLVGELKGNRDVQAYLNEELSVGRRRCSVIKLACLLHDIGKPKAKRRKNKKTIFYGHERIGARFCEKIARRLRLSNDELEGLAKMAFWHLRPGYLGDNKTISERAKFRYFRDTAEEGAGILLLSIADQRATRGPLTSKNDRLQHERICFQLIREYFRKSKAPAKKRLVNGNDIMRALKISPSVLVGKILKWLEELQAIGKVKTKPQALAAAKKFVLHKK